MEERPNNSPHNAIPVSEFLSFFEELDDEFQVGPRSFSTILELVDRKYRSTPFKAAMILFRLMALRRALDDERMAPWIVCDDPDGATTLDTVVFRVAASQPFVVTDDSACFDADSFFENVLRLSSEHGRG